MIREDIKTKERINSQTSITLFVDGACRNNNQMDKSKILSGIGYHYTIDNLQYANSKYVNAKTNNESEYQAIYEGLNDIYNNFLCYNHTIIVKSDSRLCINQLKGVFKIKNPKLLQLWKNIKSLEKYFSFVKYDFISRNNNGLADELANKGIDDYLLSNKEPLDHITLLTNLLKDCNSEQTFKQIKESIQHSSLKELKGILRID